jgi:hypothetical protein
MAIRYRSDPIRVGDKFKTHAGILEVIRTLPGGKVEMINRAKSCFHDRYTREMRDWERATGPDIAGLLRLKAAAPIKPAKPQRPCDHGLFSDEADQLDLCEMFQDQPEDGL